MIGAPAIPDDKKLVQAGVTLVELLVYMMLAVVVLAIVGGILINSSAADRSVRDATRATNAGQLISLSVGRGVRNASAVWHSAPDSTPELLMVRTAGPLSPPNWSCQAWSFSEGEIRTTKSSSAIANTQTAGSVRSWTLLARGVQQAFVGGVASPIFVVTAPRIDLPLNRVDLQMTVNAGQSPAVLITTAAIRRQPSGAIGALPACTP